MSALAAEQMEVDDLDNGVQSAQEKSLRSLKGILSSDMSYEDMKKEALGEKYGL